jgi:hypothetical protein
VVAVAMVAARSGRSNATRACSGLTAVSAARAISRLFSR